MDRGVVKLERDLVLMDQRYGEEQVRSRSHDDVKWIISFVIWLVHVLHQRQRKWSEIRKAKV
jgi:hypothetical protein